MAIMSADPTSEIPNVTSNCAPRTTEGLAAEARSRRWHRDAHRFLKRHRRELADVPVAVFAMGPRTDTAEAWQHSRAQLDRALAKHGWLTPAAVTVFGGVDPPGHGRRPRRDLRNWQAIDAWAADALAAAGWTGQGRSTAAR